MIVHHRSIIMTIDLLLVRLRKVVGVRDLMISMVRQRRKTDGKQGKREWPCPYLILMSYEIEKSRNILFIVINYYHKTKQWLDESLLLIRECMMWILILGKSGRFE